MGLRVAALLLSLLSCAAWQAGAQSCDDSAPCSELMDVYRVISARVQAPSGEAIDLFGKARDVCTTSGMPGTFSGFVQFLSYCLDDISVPDGCECKREDCAREFKKRYSCACQAALMEEVCTNTELYEQQLGVNLRNLLAHLGNDCAQGCPKLECPADTPPFDVSGCPDGGAVISSVELATPVPSLGVPAAAPGAAGDGEPPAGECAEAAPCLDQQKLLGLLGWVSNPPVEDPFPTADPLCGENGVLGSIVQVGTLCLEEIGKKVGCACNSGECKVAVSTTYTPACMTAIIDDICSQATAIEATTAADMRTLFLHLTNDCGGQDLGCPASVPAFDPAICGADSVSVNATPAASVPGSPAEQPPADPSAASSRHWPVAVAVVLLCAVLALFV